MEHPVEIVRSGTNVPDGSGVFADFLAPAINDAGQLAFYTTLNETTGGQANRKAIFLGSEQGLTQIVRTGNQAPNNMGRFTEFSAPALNNAGQSAFGATLSQIAGGEADIKGIFLATDQSLVQIVRSGDEAPDGNGFFENFSSPVVNDSGLVAFHATLVGTTGESQDNSGIFLSNGREMFQVARKSQPIEGSTFEQLFFPSDGDPGGQAVLNNLGQVAYQADLSSGGSGIFLYSLTSQLHWLGTTDDAWETASNWTHGLKPGVIHDVSIEPNRATTITGPNHTPGRSIDIRSLTIGSLVDGVAELHLQSGVLEVTEGVTINERGKLIGNGQHAIFGDIHNNGVLSRPAGTHPFDNFEIIGDYTQNDEAILQIELPEEVGDGALIKVINATLGGVLEVSAPASFQPPIGTTFDVISAYGTINGRLTHFRDLTKLGLQLHMVNGNTVQLTTTTIPEPMTISILLCVGGVILSSGRKTAARVHDGE